MHRELYHTKGNLTSKDKIRVLSLLWNQLHQVVKGRIAIVAIMPLNPVLLTCVCVCVSGFNPRWDCTLSFQLQVPELALVRFVVEDHDHTAKNNSVAQYTLPSPSLCTGVCVCVCVCACVCVCVSVCV